MGAVSLPLMLQRGVYLAITLMLRLNLLPFLIFPSSSPPPASPAYVPSPSSPPRCHRVIMGSGGRPSSFLTELLSPSPARLHLHYRYCCARRRKPTRFTLNHRLRRICCSDVQKAVHLFSMTKPQENKKKTKLGISTLRALLGSWLPIKRDYFVSQPQRE